jgi:hypothetical protein
VHLLLLAAVHGLSQAAKPYGPSLYGVAAALCCLQGPSWTKQGVALCAQIVCCAAPGLQDYCALTLPHSAAQPQLARHMTMLRPVPGTTFPQVVLLLHRASLALHMGADWEVRMLGVKSMNCLQTFMRFSESQLNNVSCTVPTAHMPMQLQLSVLGEPAPLAHGACVASSMVCLRCD